MSRCPASVYMVSRYTRFRVSLTDNAHLFPPHSHTSNSVARRSSRGRTIEYGVGNVKQKKVASTLFLLNGFISMSCGEYFGLLFGRNSCKWPEQQKRSAFSTAPTFLIIRIMKRGYKKTPAFRRETVYIKQGLKKLQVSSSQPFLVKV